VAQRGLEIFWLDFPGQEVLFAFSFLNGCSADYASMTIDRERCGRKNMNVRSIALTSLQPARWPPALSAPWALKQPRHLAQFKQQLRTVLNRSNTTRPGFHVTPPSLPIFFNYGVKNKYDDVINGGTFGGNIKGFMSLNATKNVAHCAGTFLAQMMNVSRCPSRWIRRIDRWTVARSGWDEPADGDGNGAALRTGWILNAESERRHQHGLFDHLHVSFVNFRHAIVARDYNLSFSGATPPLGLSGGQLKNFKASGTEPFDYSTASRRNSPAVPRLRLMPVAVAVISRRRRAVPMAHKPVKQKQKTSFCSNSKPGLRGKEQRMALHPFLLLRRGWNAGLSYVA